jgi:large repetitive protein
VKNDPLINAKKKFSRIQQKIRQLHKSFIADVIVPSIFVLTISLVLSVWLAPNLAQAFTAAGTPINNQASATFFDNRTGRNERLDSNIVSTPVAKAIAFTLNQSQNLVSAPGSAVRFQHAITNAGNSPESFNLLLQDAYSGTFSFTSVQLFADANNDGVADTNLPLAATPVLAPGETFRFLALAQIPTGAGVGQEDRFTLIAAPANGGAPQQTNVDTVIITNNAVIVVNKAFSVSSGPSPNSDVTVTLTYANIGNSAATNVSITDVIGAPNVSPAYDTTGMTYTSESGSWQSLALTDAPSGDTPGINYRAVSAGSGSNIVTTVNALIATVAPGASGEVKFKVDVKAGLAPGFAKTTNAALITYNDGVSTQNAPSNNTTYYRVVADGPDLTLTKRNSGGFSVGVKGRFFINVTNIGAGPTSGAVTVVDQMPFGLIVDRAALPSGGADGWVCRIITSANPIARTGETVSCQSSTLVLAGQDHVNLLVLSVIPDSTLAAKTVTNTASVSGGGETALATANNSATDSVQIGASASISGYAWFDLNHDGIRDSNEPPGVNIVVELLNSAGGIVAKARSGSDGFYTLANLAPGAGLKMVFRYPDGSSPVASTPINGTLSQADPSSTGVVSKGVITNLTLNPGLNVVQQNLRLDPSGVVYDSVTRLPVAGAVVKLEGPAGFNPVEHLVGGLDNVEQTTGSAGIYQFILLGGAPTGVYRLAVTSPATYRAGTSQILLPSNSNNCSVAACLDPTGIAPKGAVLSIQPANIHTAPPLGQDTTYYLAFYLDVATDPEIVNNHIPLDPVAVNLPGLLLEKTVNRPSAEIGDAVQYTLRVRNSSKSPFTQLQISDFFPNGFKYVAGSARLDGNPLTTDPIRDAATTYRFAGLGDLAPDSLKVLTYAAILAPGAQLGDGINRAYAMSGGVVSNTAIAKVNVTGGLFSTRGIVLGKLYVDCNHNHQQDAQELGIPGVRFYLQDGSFVVTDSEGKFSFAGLPPRTHVIKVDRTTLPLGSRLTSISNRHSLDGQSRFIDLKNGELHRADFAEFSCTPAIVKAIKERRSKGEVASIEVDRALQLKLDPEGKTNLPADIKALPAAGLLGATASTTTSSSTSFLNSAFGSVLNPSSEGSQSIAPQTPLPLRPSALSDNQGQTLNDRLNQLDNSLAILDLLGGDTLPIAQTNIRIKGVLGATLRLSVNKAEVSDARIGVKSELTDKQLQYREYIGVPLKAGTNEIMLTQLDSFGNLRGSQTISVVAPDQPGKVHIDLPTSGVGIADGVTPVAITVRITDAKGVAVTARTAITLEASVGRWQVADANRNEPGVQTFVQGGSAKFELLPPLQPTDSRIAVSSGVLRADIVLPFVPELRPLIGAGVIEGILNLRNLKQGSIQPSRARDGFEQELRQFSRETSNGKTFAAARTAFFLKGKVKGEYLLTMAYDSDKEVRERLFRDIRPDEFYPVYGDSSVKGFDAQSTSRLYLRVDKFKSYLLWGDYSTINFNPAQKLAQYQRSLTGVKHHYENAGVKVDSFASRDTTRQAIKEIPANGTSGPFDIGLLNTLANSERVEILTRDRSQPSIVIRSSVLSRFVDYAFEPLTGRILLRGPLASVDSLLNPNSLRITVEVDQGGEAFWVYGASANVKLNNTFTVGANFARNANPVADSFRTMTGVNALIQFSERTVLTAELAKTLKADGIGGRAERVEFNHDGGPFKVRALMAKSSPGFENPAAPIRPGREEVAGRVAYNLTPTTVVASEVLQSKELVSGATRNGVLVNVEHALSSTAKIEVGVRKIVEDVPTSSNLSGLVNGAPAQTDITSVRVKATSQVPGLPTALAYGEVEQDINNADKRVVALGGEYQFLGRGKLYARHEFQSSLQGAFALNNLQRTNSTVVGVSTEYMANGTLFSEYRGRDSFGLRTTEAAVGLRNIIPLSDGLRMNTNVERVQSISGSKDQNSQAYGVGLDYTASQLWKGSTRAEYRDATTSRSYLHTADAAIKLARDWTALGRHTWSAIETKASSASISSERVLQRLRMGLAYRQTDTNFFDALALVEKKRESDTALTALNTSRDVWIGSAHANFQPTRSVVLNGQVASKWAKENLSGIPTNSHTSLIGARVTYDLSERWDVSAMASRLINHSTGVSQRGLGVEVGYLLHSNVWLSAGYNFMGYRDADLAVGNHADKGAYLRLRFKFDEDTFKRTPEAFR